MKWLLCQILGHRTVPHQGLWSHGYSVCTRCDEVVEDHP